MSPCRRRALSCFSPRKWLQDRVPAFDGMDNARHTQRPHRHLDRLSPMTQTPTLPAHPKLRLAAVSFSILYLELACIRWFPSYVHFLA